MRRIVFMLIAASLLFSAAAATLAAQQPTRDMQSLGFERLVGPDRGEGITMYTLRHTAVRSGSRPGLDVGLGIVPIERGAGFIFDAGVAWTIPGDLASAHLRLGASLVMALIPGFYAGAGISVPVTRKVGFRVDAMHRTFVIPGYGSGSLWTAGAGIVITGSDRK